MQVDPTLMKRLKGFGAFDVSACFNCGNCTAVCPLSSETTSFPRRMITYAQEGLEGKLLESPDMWLCDYCAECTKTCPRQAEPSEFMMAARRFAVSKYTPTPVSRMMFTSKPFLALFMTVAALVPLGMFASLVDPAGQGFNLFSTIPEDWIHYSGIAVGVAVGVFVLAGVLRMYLRISPGLRSGGAEGPGAAAWLRALVPTVVKDSLIQLRSEACQPESPLKERLKGRWFSHLMILWGFLGLLVSTGLRFLVVPTNGDVVPITDPVRLLGTVSGVAMTYGSLALIVRRARKSEESMKHTLFTDWVFLGLLFLAGATGFVLEGFDYSGVASYTNWALVVHLVVVFELLAMAPFTKFAHVVYRPFAIWMSRAYRRI